MANKKTAKKSEINEDMTISELIEKYPKLSGDLMMMGFGCIGCSMAATETIGEGALAHGVEPKELIKELKKMVKKK